VSESINHLIVHGHFYQPPRENPWTGNIENQPSAHPFHDWNERVTAECYGPNSVSRILGRGNRILDIVNNYKSISFNFGPTLLNWLQYNSPDVYAAILQADGESQQMFSGHGNAIAQAFNHMILPLANERDIRTQILWGLEDFRQRFGRESESIWLPETAVNNVTIRILIDFGIKYIILSPHQALRTRRLHQHGKWKNVSNGSIDTNQAYRCYDVNENGKTSDTRYIDIFFYNADVSRAVAFEKLLKNAGRFADYIQHSYQNSTLCDKLVTVCTDGESYGHHEPFGDMALAYLMKVEAIDRKFKITNFGEFLEYHPPRYEVELKHGPENEGTSWSCFHGVGRWYRDCGCNTGAMSGWNQRWRRPLRDALDYLRDELSEIYSRVGAHYFLDPWKARDEYIHLIPDRSEESLDNYWRENCKSNLSDTDKIVMLKLLEMQYNAMLMYTSCGWFFADISGIETIQILQYAGRAIGLAESFAQTDLETRFLEILKDAQSNLWHLGNGSDIYKKYVKSSQITYSNIVNIYAINSFFQNNQDDGQVKIYDYVVNRHEFTRVNSEKSAVCIGAIEVIHSLTLEKKKFAYLSLKRNDVRFDIFMKDLANSNNFSLDIARDQVEKYLGSDKICSHLTEIWGENRFTFNDLPREIKIRLYEILLKERNESLRKHYLALYDRDKHIIADMIDSGVEVPYEFMISAEYSLSYLIEKVVADYVSDDNADNIFRTIDDIERFNIKVNKNRLTDIFQNLLQKKIFDLAKKLDLNLCKKILLLKEVSDRLCLPIKETDIQNGIYYILKEKLPDFISVVSVNTTDSESYQLVQNILLIAYNFNFDISQYKSKLSPAEKVFVNDPEVWP